MLEITGEHIQRLNDEDLRELVVKLCEAELKSNGLPVSGVTAGGNQTAADGGLDVRVECARPGTLQLDFVQRAVTGFQVKCQDMPPSEIASEMCPKGSLRPVIKDLITQGGAYIVVSSKGSVTDAALQRRLQAMQKSVATEVQAANLRLDFYDCRRVAAWVRGYAGVEMWVRGRVDDRLQGWQPYGCWTSDPTSSPYLHDPAGRLLAKTSGSAEAMSAAEGVDALRQKLRVPGAVIRLIGLSGTGKTRLVQALFEEGIGAVGPLDSAVAIYTDLGHSPEPSARDMLLRLGSSHQRAIVVIDNCNPGTHRSLTEIVARYKEHLSLVTVEYDVADDEPEATDVFELTPSSEEVLERILARLAPQVTQADRSLIASFSGGNARIALALARTVQRGQTLGVLNDTELFRRLFEQHQGDNDGLLHAAEACSLVYSFDGEDVSSDASELRALSALADCSPTDLFRHVSKLKQRDLVQMRGRWKAVLPHALANRLAKSALQNIPRSVILETVAPHERLLRSFSRRIGYLHDSEEACAIAERWIDDENWLAKPAKLNSLGIDLFFNLAPLAPDKVLAALEHTVRGEQGRAFTSAQWNSYHRWVSLARSLAYEPAHFERAARIILAFASAEEENRTDCRNSWRELFHAELSGTLAPPEQRGAFLRVLLAEEGPLPRQFVVDGVAAMLEAEQFNSSHDFTFGARPRGYGWEPLSDADILRWFGVAFALVREVASLGPESRDAIRSAFAGGLRQIWFLETLQPQIVALVRELADDDGWPSAWVAVRTALRFDCENASRERLAALKELEAFLSPKSPRQAILTYALGHAYGALDIADAEDANDATEDANVSSIYERVSRKTALLGEDASKDTELLSSVLLPLLSTPQGRQHAFGIGLGRASGSPKQLWTLLYDAYARLDASQRNFALLSGFLQGVRLTNKVTADELFDGLITDPVLGPIFPHLQGWPMDDDAGDRLLLAIDKGQAPARAFQVAIASPGVAGLSVEKFCLLVRRIAVMPNGLPPAIDSLSMEYHRFQSAKTAIPEALVRLGRELLDQFAFDIPDHNIAYHLKELVKICFVGVDAIPVVEAFASRFVAALENYRTQADAFGEIAGLLFKLHPRIALDAFLLTPRRGRVFPFRPRFERVHGLVVQCADSEAIVKWVDDDPVRRLPLVAAEIEILDAGAVDEPAWSDLAARLLAMADDKVPVLDAFSRSFHPSGWSGSLEQTLRPYLGLVTKLTSDSSPEIADWANKQRSDMQARIASERPVVRAAEERFE